jgi:murein tripeptide amidase MpaA
VVLISCEPKTFVDHKLIRLTVTEKSDLDWLADQYENNHELDFWLEPFRLGPIDVRLSPETFPSFTESLKSRGIPYTISIHNLQELVEQQLMRDNSSAPDAFSLTQYNTLTDIYSYLSEMVVKHAGMAVGVTVGTSYQGTGIRALRVSTGGTRKPYAIWIQAGIHAREWIAPATSLYVMTMSLEGNAAQWKQIYDVAEVYWVPSLNVDGYTYTRNTDRMWRKTRRPNSGSSCVGTDPNRNYGYGWGGPGSSNQPCSETFRGQSAYTEPEIRTTTNYLTNTVASQSTVVGFMCLHSYSQLWLSPWGYVKPGSTPDSGAQNQLGSQCVNAIYSWYGTSYTYGPISDTLYEASGGSVDWGYGQLGAVYSYTPELRDTGAYGFVLPANQIQPSGIETEAALYLWALRSLGL